MPVGQRLTAGCSPPLSNRQSASTQLLLLSDLRPLSPLNFRLLPSSVGSHGKPCCADVLALCFRGKTAPSRLLPKLPLLICSARPMLPCRTPTPVSSRSWTSTRPLIGRSVTRAEVMPSWCGPSHLGWFNKLAWDILNFFFFYTLVDLTHWLEKLTPECCRPIRPHPAPRAAGSAMARLAPIPARIGAGTPRLVAVAATLAIAHCHATAARAWIVLAPVAGARAMIGLAPQLAASLCFARPSPPT